MPEMLPCHSNKPEHFHTFANVSRETLLLLIEKYSSGNTVSECVYVFHLYLCDITLTCNSIWGTSIAGILFYRHKKVNIKMKRKSVFLMANNFKGKTEKKSRKEATISWLPAA